MRKRKVSLLLLLSLGGGLALAACSPSGGQIEDRYQTRAKADLAYVVQRVAQRVQHVNGAAILEIDIAVANLAYHKLVGVHGSIDGGPWTDHLGTYQHTRADGSELWRVTIAPAAGWQEMRYAVFYHHVPANVRYWDNNDWADYIAKAEAVPPWYGHVPPPGGLVPAILQGETWLDHFKDDLKPYWLISEAKGVPLGNFPTNRGIDGTIQGSSARRPRMLSRQVYAYALGYALTGDVELLRLARAGVDWLMTHAIDKQNGGCYEQLTASGAPLGQGPKVAQDLAYCMMGPAAYYFVTRDPAVEQELLATRDLLFDEAAFWDAANKRIRDGLDHTLTTPVDVENDGGWELVAQLDPINAFMLLVQPVLGQQQDRDQFLADMRQLAQSMIDHFHADGIFWGVHNRKWQYLGRHSDFGHTLKAYWMILQIDKRLGDHPFFDFLKQHADGWVDRAFDPLYGHWGRRMTSATAVQYGSDWWAWAEVDQTAATLNLLDYSQTAKLEQTLQGWIDHYVDKTYHEVFPSLNRDGSKVWGWGPSDTAKCNSWKNGYHSVEHAAIMYILGRNLEGKPAALHFAVPPGQTSSFTARPYLFSGTETARQVLDTVDVGGQPLTRVRVSFDEIY